MFETSQTRQPRAVVKINGTPIWGWVSFEVSVNAYREADTFSVVFASKGLPPERDTTWLVAQTTMQIEIWAGFPLDPDNYTSDDLELLISGHVDDTSVNLVARTIELTGRDLTALFIDAKTAESFKNQTAAQVVQTLASRHGLEAYIKVSDLTLQGAFYQIDHAIATQGQTEWDLLCSLAQFVGAIAYVRGMTLNFVDDPNNNHDRQFPVTWVDSDDAQTFRANVANIKFARSLIAGKTVTVTVRSWNLQQGTSFNVSFPAAEGTAARQGKVGDPTQNFSRSFPNLTKDDAMKRAQKIYNEIIKKEMRASIDMPAANPSDFDITDSIPISGTGTAFDQTYFPQSIRRSMSITGGYTMSIESSNHSDEVKEGAR